MCEATLYERDRLDIGSTIAGPAIVEQFDATTVIPPGWTRPRRRLSQFDPGEKDVARIERSEIRDRLQTVALPGFASLNPGYR